MTWICGRCQTVLEGATAGVCPACGSQDIVPTTTPRGAQLLASLPGRTPAAGGTRPMSYDDVPWYRRNGFAILCFFVFAPALILIAATGPIYYVRKGQLRTYGGAARAVIVVVCLAALVAAANALLAGRVRVEVNCTHSERTETCTVKHVSGREPAKACWSIVYHCANGTVVSAKACQTVAPDQTVNRNIDESEFTNREKCDRGVSHELTDLTITEP